MNKQKKYSLLFGFIMAVVIVGSIFLYKNGKITEIINSLYKITGSVINNKVSEEDYPVITFLSNSSGEKITNDDVVITVNAESNKNIKEFYYSFNNIDWVKIKDVKTGLKAEARIVFKDNMMETVFVKAVNKDNISSYSNKTKVRIDKEAPVIRMDIDGFTATDNYLVSKFQCSSDGIDYVDYEFYPKSKIYIKNISCNYIRAVDTAGNISKVIKVK